MKKKLTAIAALAATVLAATPLTPLTAFAAEPTQITPASDPPTGNMEVSYDVAAAYTVTIPAAVTLGDAAQTANITAADVMLPEGQKISVKLTAATNTTSGSTFHAKAGESAVTYTIQNGSKAVALGDEVAALDKENLTSTLTFAKKADAAPTFAGKHSEQLTFTIAVEDAAVAVSGITLNKTSLNLTAGGFTANLTATVQPDDATNKTVTWSSDDEAVATVDQNGKITSVGGGTAIITAKAGDKTATCTVTVLTEREYVLTYDTWDGEQSIVFTCTAGQTWNDIIAITDLENDYSYVAVKWTVREWLEDEEDWYEYEDSANVYRGNDLVKVTDRIDLAQEYELI